MRFPRPHSSVMVRSPRSEVAPGAPFSVQDGFCRVFAYAPLMFQGAAQSAQGR